jgi:DNA helicase IV
LDFPALLKGFRQAAFRGPYQMVEHLQNAPDDVRSKWLRVKFSEEFINGLEEMISSYTPVFEDVVFYRDKLCDGAKLAALYQDRTTAGTLASKTERVISYVTRCYNEYFKAYNRKITDLFNDIHDDNFSDGEIRAKFDEERSIAMADIRNRSFPRAAKILEKYLRAVAKKHDLPFTAARDGIRMDSLFFEDALLLFYIDILSGKVQGEKTVKHILLDEAQDLSILHHRILRRLYPASNFTVLADANQALYSDINITSTDTLKALYPNARAIPLTKSYRSTFEIMSFATSLLGNDAATEKSVFLRHGREPAFDQIIKGEQTAKTLEILGTLPDDFNTVGILLPTIKEAKAFYNEFKKSFPKNNAPRPLIHINAESGSFPPGIMVMAASFAKGLEFDAVICPNFRKPQTPDERKLMYLICTRALHRLYLFQGDF